jgi:hypothetical protein
VGLAGVDPDIVDLERLGEHSRGIWISRPVAAYSDVQNEMVALVKRPIRIRVVGGDQFGYCWARARRNAGCHAPLMVPSRCSPRCRSRRSQAIHHISRWLASSRKRARCPVQSVASCAPRNAHSRSRPCRGIEIFRRCIHRPPLEPRSLVCRRRLRRFRTGRSATRCCPSHIQPQSLIHYRAGGSI